MEPVIATIAAAVALGAAAGLKDTASKAVTDAYAVLKKLMQDRYQQNKSITFAAEHVSEQPEDETRRQMLEVALKSADADKDAELVKAAEALLAEVRKQPGGEKMVQNVQNVIGGSGHTFSQSGNVTVTR